MHHKEVERRRQFLGALQTRLDDLFSAGGQLPLRPGRESLGEIGSEIDLNQGQSEYLFFTLRDEHDVNAKVVSSDKRPFLGAFVYRATNKGLQLVGDEVER